MKLTRVVLAGLSLSVAPVLALQAHVNAGGLAQGEYLEWNGFRLADAAVAGLQAEQVGEALTIAIPPHSRSLAREAYAREPFATSALFIIALSRETSSGSFKRELLEAANRLERTNQLVGLALIEDAALRGDSEQTLKLVDQAARVYPELNAVFAKALLNTLEEPGAQPLLVSALKDEPVWGPSFWNAVPQDQVQLEQYLALRRSVGRVDKEPGAKRLIESLIAAGRYEDAFERWSYWGAAPANAAGFSNSADYPPLDWQLASSGGLKAQISSDGSMTLFAGSGQSGELARQWVALGPGRYALEAQSALQQGEGAVKAALQCKDSNQAIGAPQALSEKPVWEISSGDCDYARLTISADAAQSQLPLKAILRQIEFKKIG